MYLSKYSKEKAFGMRSWPSERQLLKSFRRYGSRSGRPVVFKLSDGREIVGEIRGLEHSGPGYYFGGDFEDKNSEISYPGVEGYLNPKIGEGFVLLLYEKRHDAERRIHFSVSGV